MGWGCAKHSPQASVYVEQALARVGGLGGVEEVNSLRDKGCLSPLCPAAGATKSSFEGSHSKAGCRTCEGT